jgi:DNA-binding TFAR19-related protein (PDSD5 family)
MNDLERIKQEKLRALQEQQQEEFELQKKVDQLEAVIKQLFTKEAKERFGALKTMHPEKALQVLMLVGQAMQQGQVKIIDDDKLKSILIKINQKKEFKITRK